MKDSSNPVSKKSVKYSKVSFSDNDNDVNIDNKVNSHSSITDSGEIETIDEYGIESNEEDGLMYDGAGDGKGAGISFPGDKYGEPTTCMDYGMKITPIHTHTPLCVSHIHEYRPPFIFFLIIFQKFQSKKKHIKKTHKLTN